MIRWGAAWMLAATLAAGLAWAEPTAKELAEMQEFLEHLELLEHMEMIERMDMVEVETAAEEDSATAPAAELRREGRQHGND